MSGKIPNPQAVGLAGAPKSMGESRRREGNYYLGLCAERDWKHLEGPGPWAEKRQDLAVAQRPPWLLCAEARAGQGRSPESALRGLSEGPGGRESCGSCRTEAGQTGKLTGLADSACVLKGKEPPQAQQVGHTR